MNQRPNEPESNRRGPDAHRVLITAGPTHEPIDAVRYLANRSSGRMGVALAAASARRGWPTTLLLGPTHAANPPQNSHVRTLRFQTTADLQRLLREQWPSHDVLLMAAAVADYRPIQSPGAPATYSSEKIRRSNAPLNLELEPTPDLLAEIAARSRADQIRIGFALESKEELDASAAQKLKAKSVHAIVANPLETMDSPLITASVLLRDGRRLEAGTQRAKTEFADWLLDQLSEIARSAGHTHEF